MSSREDRKEEETKDNDDDNSRNGTRRTRGRQSRSSRRKRKEEEDRTHPIKAKEDTDSPRDEEMKQKGSSTTTRKETEEEETAADAGEHEQEDGEEGEILQSVSKQYSSAAKEKCPPLTMHGQTTLPLGIIAKGRKAWWTMASSVTRFMNGCQQLFGYGLTRMPFKPEIPLGEWKKRAKEHQERSKNSILGLHILGTTKAIEDEYVLHPSVRVHIVDETTGRYLRKPSWMISKSQDTSAVKGASAGQFKPVWTDYVRPECTPPAWNSTANSAGNTPLWDESLLFHEDLSLFMQPGVLILFEIIEWGPSLPDLECACHKVAWGYLRTVTLSGYPMVDLARKMLLPPLGSSAADKMVSERWKRQSYLTPASIKQIRNQNNGKDNVDDPTNEIHRVSVLSTEEANRKVEPDTTAEVSPVTIGGIGLAFDIGDSSGQLEIQYIPVIHVQMYEYKDTSAITKRAHYSSVEASRLFVRYQRRMAGVHVDEHIATDGRVESNRKGDIDSISDFVGPYNARNVIPSPEVFIQYRLANKQELPFALAIQATSACPWTDGGVSDTESVGALIHPERKQASALSATGATPGKRSRARRRRQSEPGIENEYDRRVEWRRRNPDEPCKIPDRHLFSLPAGKIGCMTLQFSPDGNYLAAACTDKSKFPIKIFGTVRGNLVTELDGHTAVVYNLSWRSDSVYLASASADSSSKIWNVGRFIQNNDDGAVGNICAATLHHSPPTYVYCVKWHARASNHLLTSAYDGSIRLWQTSAGKSYASQDGNDENVSNEIISRPETENSSTFYATNLGQIGRNENERHQSMVNCMEFVQNGKKLFSGDASGLLYIWDSTDASNPRRYSLLKVISNWSIRGSPIVSISCRPTRDHVLIVTHNNSCKLFDANSLRMGLIRNYVGANCRDSYIKGGFSPDGKFVLTGSDDGASCIWETDTGIMKEGRAQTHKGRTKISLGYSPGSLLPSVAWHPTQHMIAVCNYGKGYPIQLYVHEIESNQKL